MPPSRKSRRPTRKELQQLKEYGELDPLNSMAGENDLDALIGNAISRSGYGRLSRSVHTVQERARRSKSDDSIKMLSSFSKTQRTPKADAYSKLLSSLSTKQSATFLKDNPLESDDEEHSDAENTDYDEENNDTEKLQQTEGSSDDNASDKNMRSDDEDDAARKSEDEYEVDEVDYTDLQDGADEEDAANAVETDKGDKANGDDDDVAEVYESGDFMAAHLEDDDSELAHKKLAAASQKEYKSVLIEDPIFGPIAWYNTTEEGIKEPNERPLKQRLVKPFHKLNRNGDLTEFQRPFFNWIDQYRDVVYSDRTFDKEDEITTMYALHAMNHVMKSRDRERKNNAKISKAQAAGKDSGEHRDRGFTRPRILILVPFRNNAYNVVKKLLKLASAEKELNSSRFEREYGPGEDEDNANRRKPMDYQQTFAGNIDDAFRIGLQLHHRTVKLYSDFYRSDILIASPIGLRMTTGAQGGDRKDFDFLSSIEMVVVDQCDVLLMQNWDHITHIFGCLNVIPKKDHGCDFSRVRNWALEGMAQYRRQTILISEYMTPEIQALFNNNCRSIEGKLRVKPTYDGSITNVVAKVSQVFKRVAVGRLASAADERFAHFTENVLPEIEKSAKDDKHTVIFVSSYFDFVRVRNHLRDKNSSFVAISEYSTRSEAMNARRKFHAGELSFILYSERAHFYHRYPIKGIHHMVFYSLPDHPHYYSEMVNLMLTSNDPSASADKLSCTAFYTKYDQLKVERVVGTRLVSQLLQSERAQYTFA
ncbi:rRNA-binding ribosome biosynthesis protein utp25 [Coemansia sp. RSA 1813]|nr:rRNA-binding ribosome biosynthesis protein utp25 [Coemansia sp. RSA 1646]KAJ1766005.1 rRNA-binding ribosome biosynthesis protein utp25 [Coemansia sp. RSA 1843]KAJ2090563.1 rRNA-binding ribosome biosynthesis protein utp25 [Coemansia sp. RSA 986]KAJ2216349.1 rRNA-binding ribosome biosynthesis protein utp25 [Coemansia sp. RSA 487]KAJ2570866.1 rRNA-binding ribosome biosynthesis protein utp25 [Coemansia sp. RSA 1813]